MDTKPNRTLVVMKKIIPFLKNPYVILSIFFLVWMFFIDRNDFFAQQKYRERLDKLKADKAYYEEEIAKTQKDMEELTSDPKKLEKFAREKYLMKRENEDVFVIVEE